MGSHGRGGSRVRHRSHHLEIRVDVFLEWQKEELEPVKEESSFSSVFRNFFVEKWVSR